MWKTAEGSTGRLLQLCFGYFFFYVITGVAVKYFLGKPALGLPGMDGMKFLVYSTTGGTGICMIVVLALGWYKLKSNGHTQLGPLTFPREFYYIVPSGICTAVVIPTTTLMYSLPISVMVAMVMMRGSVIVISRAVDAVQTWQGILKKKVYFVEDVAVGFAIMAVAVEPAMGVIRSSKGDEFAFLRSGPALTILGSYIAAYAIRIYIMNYYKNTRGKGVQLDNKGFLGVEQIAAFGTMVVVGAALFYSRAIFGWNHAQLDLFRESIVTPDPLALWAILSGTAFGIVAFFSVFIFMFKGRTATFAGLVNRLTSLIAGTAATLVFALWWDRSKLPRVEDWLSLGFILISVGFLTSAEMRRAAELAAAKELAPEPAPPVEITPVEVSDEKRETAEG